MLLTHWLDLCASWHPCFPQQRTPLRLLVVAPTPYRQRGEACAPLPQWRKRANRPSCLDLVALLRKETALNPHLLTPLDIQPSFSALSRAADA